MRVLVLVNECLDVGPVQTTTLLIAEGLRRGHDVSVASIADVGWSDEGGVVVQERSLDLVGPTEGAEIPGALLRARTRPRAISARDLVLIRTSPGRDTGRARMHLDALALLGVAERRGATVLNRPGALLGAGGKLLLLDLPESMRPRCLVTADLKAIADFVQASAADVVLKPIHGSRGIDVFRVHRETLPPHGTPLDEALAALDTGGPILAQPFVPEAEFGDTRVIVAGGEVLRVSKRPCAFRRVPGDGDWRSNMHAGAQAGPPEWTPRLEALCEAAARRLYTLGIWSAGLDVIGDRIIEVNVFAPGGLGNAGRFADANFVPALFASAEREAIRG
jgi:glutathione synthase